MSSVVHEDAQGLYIRINGGIKRPGEHGSWAHAYDMATGKLRAGDRVWCRHVSGTSMCKIKLADGRVLHWADEYEHERGMIEGVRNE